jgi:hypothetical protein
VVKRVAKPLYARDVALLLVALTACGSSPKPNAGPNAPLATATATTTKTPSATAAPAGQTAWLPVAQNGELDIIEGAPLVAVDGSELVVDGLRIGDVSAALKEGRPTRLGPLFDALRSRREAWLSIHPGEPWPGVVAYRFGPEVSAAVVKSVVLTSGYAACPNGSFLVETRADGHRRVGRLAVDPLMVTEPDEKIFTVDVKKEAFVVTWRETKTTGRTKAIPRTVATESHPITLSALATEVTAMWEAAGLHRAANDKRFDQVILHVDDAVPYAILVAVIDALYAPRRSLQVGRRDERVPALNVNLASD